MEAIKPETATVLFSDSLQATSEELNFCNAKRKPILILSITLYHLPSSITQMNAMGGPIVTPGIVGVAMGLTEE